MFGLGGLQFGDSPSQLRQFPDELFFGLIFLFHFSQILIFRFSAQGEIIFNYSEQILSKKQEQIE